MKRLLATVGLFLTLGFVSNLRSEPQDAIVITEVAITANGVSLAQLQPGSTVVVLGEKADTEEFIVRHADAEGKPIVGMVPRTALAISSKPSPPPSTPAPSPKATTTATLPGGGDKAPMSALAIARLAKESRSDFLSAFKGTQVTIFGSIEKASIESMSGSAEKQPVITLATEAGMPKVEIHLSPSIARSADILKNYRYFPTWYYGYYGGQLEFRQSGRNQIEVRASYKRSSTYSDGYRTASKHSTQWSPMFSPGDPMTVEGFVSGVGVDVEIEGAFLVKP